MSKTQIFILLSLLLPGITGRLFAQVEVNGIVSDHRGGPIPGANVYLEDTYDGATSSEDGRFRFSTTEVGDQMLIVSFVGYHTLAQPVDLDQPLPVFQLKLTEMINKMESVVISAGSFEASDEKKAVILKPLDVAMTAGATADIPGALNTLPGTQTNGESGRLFVRGGTGEETKVFIDGMLAHDFYSASEPNTPGRSRFSPFLFKGVMFSTGGYSAEYGQALSSTLSLNSLDLPDETESNISLMTVGGDVSHTKLWNNSSLFTQIGYTNLNPYIGLVDQAFDFEKGFSSVDGIVSYRKRTEKGGMIKLFGNFNTAGLIVNQFNIDDPGQPNRTDLRNDFFFLNGTWKEKIGSKWFQRSGFSFTLNDQEVGFNQSDITDRLAGVHLKTVFENDLSEHITLRFGAEDFIQKVTSEVSDPGRVNSARFHDHLIASFAESDIYLSPRFVLRPGLRTEYSTYLEAFNLAPRMSLAYKTSEYAQVSAAAGRYYQAPENDFLLVTNDIDFEISTHYILNYQMIKDGRIFRIEGYYKDYDQLTKFDEGQPRSPDVFNNDGDGFARGIDLFWRDSKTFKNIDYWVSYSFLDTRRNFRDYPAEAVPSFASTHNFSLVYKHWISALRTQFGWAYNFTSGRPYHDPNREGFNQRKIPAYHDLSFNAAYLYKSNVIFYTSITNLPGWDNIFGYQYASVPNSSGKFDRVAIGQPARRFYFLGVFITLTKDKTKNQLQNL